MPVLPESPWMLTFLGASLVLAISPGPAVVYIVARTVAQGRASGMASVIGVAFGNFANALGAALGLAALFAVSAAAFTAVKWAGAAYLVYLGVRMRMTEPTVANALPQAHSLQRVFRDGLVVALLNPKTALFFAAFLPQFVDVRGHPLLQTVTLGSIFVAVAACTDLVYVFMASLIAPWLRRTPSGGRWGQRVAGLSLIGLGLMAAVAGQPSGDVG